MDSSDSIAMDEEYIYVGVQYSVDDSWDIHTMAYNIAKLDLEGNVIAQHSYLEPSWNGPALLLDDNHIYVFNGAREARIVKLHKSLSTFTDTVQVDKPLLTVDLVKMDAETTYVSGLEYNAEEVSLELEGMKNNTRATIIGTVLDRYIRTEVATNSNQALYNSYLIDNYLIQSPTYARNYAAYILKLKSTPFNHLILSVRGSAAMGVGSRAMVYHKKYGVDGLPIIVSKYSLQYEGGLEGSIEGYVEV
jgi:hypothetical protein